jgi:hypothetical protein
MSCIRRLLLCVGDDTTHTGAPALAFARVQLLSAQRFVTILLVTATLACAC